MKITIDAENKKVIISSDRLEPEGSELHVAFTDEGIIADLIDTDGEVIASRCEMYEDFVDGMLP